MGIRSYDLYKIASRALANGWALRIGYTDDSFIIYATCMYKKVVIHTTSPGNCTVAFVKEDGTHNYVHSLDKIISINIAV